MTNAGHEDLEHVQIIEDKAYVVLCHPDTQWELCGRGSQIFVGEGLILQRQLRNLAGFCSRRME